ncbi:hypothetical protein Fmac_016835 [Flemingia macrophylla]|uniref:RNA ligase/cyclic nucleotide phosphodiesterase family protein n=1 Tax=Flemingia macrophylla TaxID=520843 RepID=A0ABD1MII6_9FABA
MSEGFAIELYLEPALENQVLKAWNVMARRQISTHLIETESRPHITLLSAPFLEPSKVEPLLRAFASKHEPLPLSFSSLATFPSHPDNLLFLAPTPSAALLHLHSHLCDAIRKESFEIADQFAVDSWIPHCPVARHVPKQRIAEAFSLLRELKLPVSGYAVDIALVQFSPVRELFSFALGNNPVRSSITLASCFSVAKDCCFLISWWFVCLCDSMGPFFFFFFFLMYSSLFGSLLARIEKNSRKFVYLDESLYGFEIFL